MNPPDLEKIAKAYSSPPWFYDVRGAMILTFAYRSSMWRQLKLFGTNMSNNHLELACGTATLTKLALGWRALKRLPFPTKITCVDYAESMLGGARARFKGERRVTVQHGDAGALTYPNNHFSSINIANSVHCFPDLNAALKETYRVLAPGGTFAANVLLFPRGPSVLKSISQSINDWGIKKGILVTPYEHADIRKRVIDAGFQFVYEDVAGNTYDFVAKK